MSCRCRQREQLSLKHTLFLYSNASHLQIVPGKVSSGFGKANGMWRGLSLADHTKYLPFLLFFCDHRETLAPTADHTAPKPVNRGSLTAVAFVFCMIRFPDRDLSTG